MYIMYRDRNKPFFIASYFYKYIYKYRKHFLLQLRLKKEILQFFSWLNLEFVWLLPELDSYFDP